MIPDSIMAFAWEPVGHRFAFIHGETPRIQVSFYVVKKNGSVELISEWQQFIESSVALVVPSVRRKLAKAFCQFIESSVALVVPSVRRKLAKAFSWSYINHALTIFILENLSLAFTHTEYKRDTDLCGLIWKIIFVQSLWCDHLK